MWAILQERKASLLVQLLLLLLLLPSHAVIAGIRKPEAVQLLQGNAVPHGCGCTDPGRTNCMELHIGCCFATAGHELLKACFTLTGCVLQRLAG
jgi:hypothetical protein